MASKSKAFISDREARVAREWHPLQPGVSTGETRGLLAVREAERILAETEPETSPYERPQATWGKQGVYCLPGPMASALADSLAAWIGQ